MGKSPAQKPVGATVPAAAEIYHNLIRTMVFLHKEFDPSRAWKGLPHNVSFPQFKMMMTLRHIGPCTLKQLAEALGISPASASEMIERLVELELVDRRSDPRDRRRIQVSLTRRAIVGVERHEAMIYKRLDALREQIGPKHAQMWADAFDQLGRVYDEHFHHPGRE